MLLANVLPGLSTGYPKGKIALVAYRQPRIIESARVDHRSSSTALFLSFPPETFKKFALPIVFERLPNIRHHIDG